MSPKSLDCLTLSPRAGGLLGAFPAAPVAVLAALGSLVSAGCVCPPCPGAGASSPSAVLPVGSKLVIWNGEGDQAGANPQAWADCGEKKAGCKAKLESVIGQGKDGGTGLKYHGEGSAWMGGGWNWFGWWPADSGTDIGSYTHLSFAIRVQAKSKELAPDPSAIGISLGCSKGGKHTATVAVDKYARTVLDGKWHNVSIPFKELLKGDGRTFDTGSAWEFAVNLWFPSARDFDIYFDDITVEKN